MLLSLIVSLLIIGVLLYVVEVLLPIDYRIKTVIYVLVAVYVVLYLLAALGVNVPFVGNLIR